MLREYQSGVTDGCFLPALFTFFFFSSRRRHTRFDCDWSSDVCSSDLPDRGGGVALSIAQLHPLALVAGRSEEHTSELQSQSNLVCRLLLEKKKKNKKQNYICMQSAWVT